MFNNLESWGCCPRCRGKTRIAGLELLFSRLTAGKSRRNSYLPCFGRNGLKRSSSSRWKTSLPYVNLTTRRVASAPATASHTFAFRWCAAGLFVSIFWGSACAVIAGLVFAGAYAFAGSGAASIVATASVPRSGITRRQAVAAIPCPVFSRRPGRSFVKRINALMDISLFITRSSA